MKILFVQPAGEAYGSEKSMLGLLAAACDFRAEVVCPPRSPLFKTLETMGIKSHWLEFGKHAFQRRPDWHLLFFARFCRILRRVKPEVVVVNLDGNTPAVVLASVAARIPVVRYSRFEFIPPKRWIDKYSWLKCAAIICPSDHVRRQVLDWTLPRVRPRVHRVYGAQHIFSTSADEVQRLRSQLNLGTAQIIGVFGRLHPGKRVETAIQAFHNVQRAVHAARLIIVGSHDGSPGGELYLQRLVDLVREFKVEGAVSFLGYREDALALMSLCDVSVLPSESESFGRVLVEAWSCQVPTIASDVSGCREISLASQGGLLFPVGDSNALARHLLDFLLHPAAAKTRGGLGQAWVRANCDPAACADTTRDLLLKVAQGSWI